MAEVAAELEIAAEPVVVFSALTDLDLLPQWLSVPVGRLAVPDGALHEYDRFPVTVTIDGRALALRCQVVELHRPSQITYEVRFDDHVIVLGQHCAPTTSGTALRVSVTDPAGRLDSLAVERHLDQSLQRFARTVSDRS